MAPATAPAPIDVRAVRGHFSFPGGGRVVTSNAASTQPPRELAGLYQLLVDRAPLVPGPVTGVRRLGAGYLAFSFHKMLAPSGAGVLYAGEHLLAAALPFLYGGDMIAAGRVFPGWSGTTRCRGSTPPAPRTSPARSSPPEGCGCCWTWP